MSRAPGSSLTFLCLALWSCSETGGRGTAKPDARHESDASTIPPEAAALDARGATPRGWLPAELLGTGKAMRLAVGGDGSALLVWSAGGGSTFSLEARRFSTQTGWGESEELFSGTNVALASDAPLLSSLSMNDAGQGVVAWRQWDGTRGAIWADRFAPGEGWAAPVIIEEKAGDDPRGWDHGITVAIGDDGTAFAVFDDRDGPPVLEGIRTSRQPPGGVWTAPEVLNQGSYSLTLERVCLAVSPSGSAMATWSDSGVPGQPAIGPSSGRFARFDPALGWSTAETIVGTPGVGFLAPTDDGSYVAVTEGSDGLRSNRYDPATGWKGSRLVEASRSNVSTTPSLSVNRPGTAVLSYSFYGAQAYVRFLRPGADWTEPEELAKEGADSGAAIDDDGNVTAVWQPNGGSGPRVWASRRDGEARWSPPVNLVPGSDLAFLPIVRASPTGSVFAAWISMLNDGLWVARYLP